MSETEFASAQDRFWREEDGVIYFSVTSDGATGAQWIDRLVSKGRQLSVYDKSLLLSPEFVPTNGMVTEIAVLQGSLFDDQDRITSKIRAEADRRGWSKPNAEVACLIHEMFTDEAIEAMGLWYIVTMHEPIKDSGSGPDLLFADRDDGGRWWDSDLNEPACGWERGHGFAFAVSQVSP